MKIYYVPFNVETYVPVTINNIEDMAFYKFEVHNNSELAIKLINLLEQNGHNDFDDKRVRLKVINNGKTYYVDSNCNIKVSGVVSKCNIKDIELILNEMIVEYRIQKSIR